MLEARSFVKSLDKVREILLNNKAIFKGEYKIHDIIFASKNKSLTEEFLRLRIISKNIWNEKDVIVAIKNTELKEKGKNSVIPLKKQFDTQSEGQDYINNNLLNEFKYLYEFDRTGWQYDIREDQIDLEDIEGHYSIEVKSKNEEGLRKLIELFEIEEIIEGPSVVRIREILGR